MNLAALVMAGMMALAGLSSGPGVVGTGRETVTVMPDTMTMTVDLVGTDEQFDRALASVQQQADAAQKALSGLKTQPAKVTVEGPATGLSAGSSGQASIPRQVLQAMGRGTGQAEEKKKVTLSSVVTAEWKLTATDAVALLKESQAIRDAVGAAMPKPAEKEGALTEEQEEQMMSMMSRMDENQAPPGTPSFIFSATLPADKLRAARKAAYQKAQADAKSLAEAAGFGLAGLTSLSGTVTQGTADETYYYYMRAMPWLAGAADTTGHSVDAHELTFVVGVEADFALGPAGM
jgi:uncharacterized protein YggE